MTCVSGLEGKLQGEQGGVDSEMAFWTVLDTGGVYNVGARDR